MVEKKQIDDEIMVISTNKINLSERLGYLRDLMGGGTVQFSINMDNEFFNIVQVSKLSNAQVEEEPSKGGIDIAEERRKVMK